MIGDVDVYSYFSHHHANIISETFLKQNHRTFSQADPMTLNILS